VGCGRIRDVHVKVPENGIMHVERALGEATDYEIFGHNLEFTGLCPGCMEESENAKPGPANGRVKQGDDGLSHVSLRCAP
jgi:hypothetical protein